jgi:hypothetical protein
VNTGRRGRRDGLSWRGVIVKTGTATAVHAPSNTSAVAAASYPPEPPNDVQLPCPDLAAARWARCIGKDLQERLSLEVQIRPGVGHCRVERCVAEPLTDGREVNAGLEKVNGRRSGATYTGECACLAMRPPNQCTSLCAF